MMKEFRDALYGGKSGTDLYKLAYEYTHADLEDLLEFMQNEVHSNRIYNALYRERKRLDRINTAISTCKRLDSLLRTDSAGLLRLFIMRNALIRYCRYASLRDRGEEKSNDEIKRIKRALRSYLTNGENLKNIRSGKDFFSIDRLISVCNEFAQIDTAQTNFIDEYISDFLKACPEKYLSKGVFAKVIGSFFGLMKYGYEDPDIDYDAKIRLGLYFGTTYLFDDIMDDHDYSVQEREEYYKAITGILSSQKGETVIYSKDPLMAFSESALTGMRDLLDERRWRAVADSYIVLARASESGTGWSYDERLTDDEIYTNSVIKGSFTRIIPGLLAYQEIDENFLSVCIRTGYIYQMTDDLRDFFTDLSEGNISSFTYYSGGVCRPGNPPIEILLSSIGRLAYIDHKEIPNADRLYLQSVIFSIKALRNKNRSGSLLDSFTEMKFPDDRVTEELCRIGELHDAIIDPETELAEIITSASLKMKKQDDRILNYR